MTDDDDLSPDPAVTAALRAWAAATDPADDLVGGPSVRARATARARWAGPRALLVAAAVVAVLLVAGAVWALAGDDPDTVVTDPGPAEEAGVGLDVVVQTTGIVLDDPHYTRSIEIGDVRRPIVAGTSLVWSEEVADGSTWRVTVRTWDCGEAPCALDADGSPPGDEDGTPTTCETTFRVDGPTLATVGLSGSVDQPECGASTGGPVPALTVPRAFTLRPSYPWDCGSGVGAVGGSDGDTDVRSWDCLAGALSGGDPVELVVVEARARGVSARSWWRAGEDEGLVIFREPRSTGGPPGTAELDRWTVQECAALVEDPEGPPGTRTSAGCAEPTEVDLVYDGPAGRPEPTGPVDPAPTLDLVVVGADADAGAGDPTTIDRWVLTDEGLPVTSGPIEPATTSLGGWDLPLAGRLTIRWDTYACEVACAPASPAGTPLDGTAATETRCEREIPAGATRVVVRFQSVDGAPGGATCAVTPVEEIPPLTVPPAWSLRERYASSCAADSVPGESPVVADGPTPHRSSCLAQAFAAGEQVEMESTEGDERRIVWRVAFGIVTITRPPTTAEPGWTQQTCTGLVLISPAVPPYLDPQGCGPAEPMTLDPP